MKVIYTEPRKDFRPAGATVRNPRYFNGAREGVKEVVIVGRHPRIAKAYQEAGAKVTEVASIQELSDKKS